MKRFFYLLPILLLASCHGEPLVQDSKVELTAVFSEAVTKTGFDGAVFQWRTGDRIRVALQDGSTLDMRYGGANTSGAAVFSQTESPSSSIVFGEAGYALYPSLAAGNIHQIGSTLTLTLKDQYYWSDGNVEAPMMAPVLTGQKLAFSHLGGVLKVSLTNIPSAAARLIVCTPGYAITENLPVQGWEGRFVLEKPFVQAVAGEDGCIGLSFTPGSSSAKVFYVPLPVGPGNGHVYPKIKAYLVDGSGNLISGTMVEATDIRIERATIKPMHELDYPELKTPGQVTTLFGNGTVTNAVGSKKGGDKADAVLGAVRGLGWIVPDKKAFVLEQAQTVRIWDVETGTLSDPYTYGDASHVPWLGVAKDGLVWFAEKAKAKVYTFNPDTKAITQIAAQTGWSGKSVMDVAFDGEGNGWMAVRDLNTIYKYSGGDFTASPSFTVNLGKWPNAMAFDADGNLMVVTNGCQLIKVNPTTGSFEAVAGILNAKAFDDGTAGSPLTAKFSANLADLAIAPNGDIYVADSYKIRRIRKGASGYADAIVTTVAGGSQCAASTPGTDGVGTSATFRQLGGLLLNSTGTVLYITDQGLGQIRELYLGNTETPVVPSSPKIRAATFNIRFETDKDTEERSWTSRRTGVVQLIKDYGFEVVGFQESRPAQRTYLKANLPEYTFFETPEEPCLAWNTAKFVELGKGCFYLSSTPDVPSSPYPGWVSTDPGRKRLCQWVKLEDRASGYKVLYLNTHLEVKSSGTSISEEEAVTIRTKSAELICNRIASLNADGNFAVILGGDMNSSTTESAHVDWFKSQLTDSYYRSADLGVKEGPVATYNAYSYDDEQRSKWYHRIDYLYFKGNMDVLKYKVIDDKYNGYFPSDHWPLMVDFTLK